VSSPAISAVQRPHWTPNARELDDLELLGMGLLSPVRGFTGPGDSPRITLVVDAEVAESAAAAGVLDLLDPEGVTLSTLRVRSTYPADHGRTGLVGEVSATTPREYGPFRAYHVAPDGDTDRLAVVVRRPLTVQDLEAIRSSADGRRVVLLAFTGIGSPRGLTAPALVRATLVAGRLLAAEIVAVSVPDHADPETDRFVEDSVALSYADEALRLGPAQGPRTPEVDAIVARDQPSPTERGLVLFFTGLSGSGKSTLARGVLDRILERGDRTVTSLDGDVVRHLLSKGLGFSRDDRETNIVRIGFVASEISRHGGVAICSPIAPFEATRAQVRAMTAEAGGEFVLVHVATPLAECERRDRKGLYARARAGLIPEFTGISSPYEEPFDANMVIDTTGRDIDDCVGEIMSYLVSQGWLVDTDALEPSQQGGPGA
jgi:sulfate adenylyltransferase